MNKNPDPIFPIQVIYFLESVLSEIKARSFHVKAIVEWQRFRAGA